MYFFFFFQAEDGIRDLTVTGVQTCALPISTGTGTDLVTPTVVSTFPTANQANVPVNSTLQAVFSQAMDPASFDVNNSFTLRDASNNVIPATITFSADFKTVTLQPNSNLTGGGSLYDVGGNVLN